MLKPRERQRGELANPNPPSFTRYGGGAGDHKSETFLLYPTFKLGKPHLMTPLYVRVSLSLPGNRNCALRPQRAGEGGQERGPAAQPRGAMAGGGAVCPSGPQGRSLRSELAYGRLCRRRRQGPGWLCCGTSHPNPYRSINRIMFAHNSEWLKFPQPP